jgi:hypothetical protein
MRRVAGQVWRWLKMAFRERPRLVVSVFGAAVLGAFGYLGEAISAAINGDFDSSAWIWAVLALAISGVILYDEVKKTLDEPNLDQLNRKLRKADERFGDIEVELAGVLRLIMREQVFDPNGLDATERVAVYARDKKRFIRLERVEINPDYATSGKHFLRDGYGCVGQAWKSPRQFYFCDDMSDNREEWIIQQMNRFSLQRQEAEQLTMQTRCYAAFVLHDANSEAFAVLVFESTQTYVLKLEALQAFVHSPAGKQFARIAARVAAMKKPSIASEAGFGIER